MIRTGRTILETIPFVKPQHLLDVGCGCGQFTSQLAQHCGEITAIDVSQELIDRCKREHPVPNVHYECLDATGIPFPDRSFDVAVERDTLHHISNWQDALEEMIRVSSTYVLIQEPIDDLRSDVKRRTVAAQDLFLELQREVGYPHFRHLAPQSLEDFLRKTELTFESRITADDREVSFDELFDNYSAFANRTERPEYWSERLELFRESLSEATFCESDIIFIVATKI